MFGDNTGNECDFAPKQSHPHHVATLAAYFDQFEHVEFVDLTNYICQEGKCAMKVGSDNAMYTDASHLSYKGAEIVLSSYQKELSDNQQLTAQH